MRCIENILLFVVFTIVPSWGNFGKHKHYDIASKYNDLEDAQKRLSAHLEKVRIVGGMYTTIQNHPYMAVLPNCGAVILAKSWIMTAAHCYHKDVKHVRVGSSFKDHGQRIRMAVIIKHPDFFIANTGAPYNDVMLIKLETPLTFSDKVKPIAFGSDEDIRVGQSATATGYGRLSEGGKHAAMLTKVDLPILNHRECEEMYRTRYKITSAEFCAGYAEGKRDACQGDSGGPLVINNRLIGITSFGEGCARLNSPGVFVRVPVIKDWAQYVMDNF